ncbi:Helicase [Giardia muris]|uniref:ATP-dependent RNA helicase n=1 Tax=Giardia muris TaxID=5742 RepID=A0A4Z1T8F6_GIAMU|nr:Helicase [Giardia muris]|eukprot:TNJ28869.1 Helicase [Giardia muris]
MSEPRKGSLLDPSTTWKDLGVSTHIVEALDSCGFPTPSSTQTSALKHILQKPYPSGLFEAPTGTGKTLAFLTAAMERVNKTINAPQVTIVAHTKILAIQIYGVAKDFGSQCGISVGLCIRDEDMDKKDAPTEKTHVIVGLALNLKSFFAGKVKRGSKGGPQRVPGVADAGKVIMAIVDEADVFCQGNIKEDLRTFFSIIPPSAQRLMFSATLNDNETEELTELFIDRSKPFFSEKFSFYLGNTAQFIVASPSIDDKLKIIKNVLNINFGQSSLSMFVFCEKKVEVDRVTEILERDGYTVAHYHSDVKPKKRREMFHNFTAGNIHCMICTDGLARGIDVSQVILVINLHPPVKWEDGIPKDGDSTVYIHRIGRGGRFGRASIALTLFTEDERKYVEQIKKEVTNRYECQKQTDELVMELTGDMADVIKGDTDSLPVDNIYHQLRVKYKDLAALVDKYEEEMRAQDPSVVGVDNNVEGL